MVAELDTGPTQWFIYELYNRRARPINGNPHVGNVATVP